MVTTKEMLEKAIFAHAQWRHRLKSAISAGKIDIPVATIAVDDACEFGKLLHGCTDGGANCAKVKGLHATFHKEAAAVAQLAVAGHTHQAEEALGVSGPFTQASSKLTAAMAAWKSSL